MRALAYLPAGDPDGLRLRARTGNDITTRYPELAEVGQVRSPNSGDGPIVLDGEVVMFDDDGRPSFGALQHRMHIADPAVSRRLAAERSVVYVVFDVLWGPDGSYLDRTYDERRALLADLEFAGDRVLVPSAELGDPATLVEFCRSRELEGVISKKRDSRYRPGDRTSSWVKTKFLRSQELLVLGWTEGTGGRAGHLGALLLGYHEADGTLRFAGKVGTGFSDRELKAPRCRVRDDGRGRPDARDPTAEDGRALGGADDGGGGVVQRVESGWQRAPPDLPRPADRHRSPEGDPGTLSGCHRAEPPRGSSRSGALAARLLGRL